LRLQPFLHRKGAQSKVIIYLIIAGYDVPDLIRMDAPTLRRLALPIDLAVLVDELLNTREKGPAFLTKKGKAIPYTYYYRLVRETTIKVLKKPLKIDQFRAWIRKT